MSETIFLQLFERALLLDETSPVDFHARWIRRLSDADADLMAKADVTSLKLSSTNCAALISYKGEVYFGVSGFDEPAGPPPGLTPVEMTPGLFSGFVVTTMLDSTASSAQIRDIIEGLNATIPDYEGHDLKDIASLFPRVLFFEVNTSYIYTNSIERLFGSFLSRNYHNGSLPLYKVTIESFSNFFEDGSDWIPYSLPLRGLLSFSWDGLFLELYRCIEQLYSVPRIVKLVNVWESRSSIYDLSKILEDILSWRPKEDESLEFLFSELDNELCVKIRDELRSPEGKNRTSAPYIHAAKGVYKLRNTCVHFRPFTQQKTMTDRKWNSVIALMITAVDALYEQHGKRFHQPLTL